MNNSVHVDLGKRSYEILIDHGLLKQSGSILQAHLVRPKVAVITDETVAGFHLEAFKASCAREGIDVLSLVLPAGETTKSWQHLQNCVEWMLSERIERDDLVVALGGGVIGDLVGFASSIMRRGVRFIQIPTSLLAQVDSSVGGKTGINSPIGKNLVGVFAQPQLVIIDVELLETMAPRDFLAGYGEVVKYGLLGDASFFDWLEENGADVISGDTQKRIHAVRHSCQMKADIVARDETEKGDRALLNLGHTFAHALEAATGYCDVLKHGEAVAVGCALAFETSAKLGLCSQEDPSRIMAHLDRMGMRKSLVDLADKLPNADGLIELMRQDKKVKAGTLNFIMAKGIGQAFVTSDVDLTIVKDVLNQSLEG